MCDCLVALPAATEGACTLFAKNSDRPPAERQVVHWSAPRRDLGVLRTTHIDVAAHDADTLGCVLSRPAWGWGAEHGVNEAGVAIGNTTVYTTLDPRGAAPALTGMDLVRLALERATSAIEAVAIITALLERHGQGGSGHDPALSPNGRPYWNAFLVASAGTAFVIDTSGREWAAEPVGDVRAISNRTSIPGFDATHRHPRPTRRAPGRSALAPRSVCWPSDQSPSRRCSSTYVRTTPAANPVGACACTSTVWRPRLHR